MEYLPWLLAFVFAVLVIVSVCLLLREKKARAIADKEHENVVLGLEEDKRVLNESLNDAETENKRKTELLELVDRTQLAQKDKVQMYAFDKQSSEQLLGAREGELDTASEPLLSVLERASESGELKRNEACFFAVTEESENARVYLLNNVTDKYTISALNGEINGLNSRICGLDAEINGYVGEIQKLEDNVKRLEGDVQKLENDTQKLEGDVKKLESDKAVLEDRIQRSDIITSVMNIDYFCKNIASFVNGKESALVFVKTEANLPQADSFGKSREIYLKACAEKIIAEFPTCRVARYSEDSFCCLFAGDNCSKAAEKAETILKLLGEAGRLLSLCNGHHVDKNVIEIADCKLGDVEKLVFCLDIKAKFDRNGAKFGVQTFGENDYTSIFEYKNGISKFAEKKKVKFKYRPISDSTNGRAVAYQMIPYFPETAFKSFEELLDGVAVFGYAEEFEEAVYTECMKAYKKAVKDGLIFHNIRVWISSIPDVCMTNHAEKSFREKYYDELQNLISEISEEVPAGLDCARIKKKRISEWGASCIIDCTEDSGYNMIKIELMSPDIVRVPASIVCSEKHRLVLADIKARIEGRAKLLVDNISTVSELREAIAAGADYLAGEYIGEAENEPPCVANRCMRQIGLIRFGKKRG